VYKETCILRIFTVKEHLFVLILSHFRHMQGGNLKMQYADWPNHCKDLPVGYVVK